MEYEEHFDARDTGSRGGISRVFVGSPYQRGHGIGSFLGGLFRKILPFLNRGARAVGKEALRAGINVIEDIENNKPLKEAIKCRLVESRGNLKRKAKEKISSLMRGSGYKISTKSAALQFPLGGRDRSISHRKRRRGVKRKSSRSITGRKSKKVTRKKKIRAAGRKTKKSSARKHRGKKRDVSDIFS